MTSSTTVYGVTCVNGHTCILTWEEVDKAFGYDVACNVEIGSPAPRLDASSCPECQIPDLDELCRSADQACANTDREVAHVAAERYHKKDLEFWP